MTNVEAKWEAVFQKNYGTPKLNIVSGKGCYVTADSKKRYLDFIGGIATNVLGQAHPAITKAVRKQIGLVGHVSNLYASPTSLALAEKLIQITGHGDARVFFCNSGAEANEAALKLSRKTGRRKVVSTIGGFHGRTMGALSLTGQPEKRDLFAPIIEKIKYVTSSYFSGFGRGSSILGSATDPTHKDLVLPIPSKEVLDNINSVFDAKITDSEIAELTKKAPTSTVSTVKDWINKIQAVVINNPNFRSVKPKFYKNSLCDLLLGKVDNNSYNSITKLIMDNDNFTEQIFMAIPPELKQLFLKKELNGKQRHIVRKIIKKKYQEYIEKQQPQPTSTEPLYTDIGYVAPVPPQEPLYLDVGPSGPYYYKQHNNGRYSKYIKFTNQRGYTHDIQIGTAMTPEMKKINEILTNKKTGNRIRNESKEYVTTKNIFNSIGLLRHGLEPDNSTKTKAASKINQIISKVSNKQKRNALINEFITRSTRMNPKNKNTFKQTYKNLYNDKYINPNNLYGKEPVYEEIGSAT